MATQTGSLDLRAVKQGVTEINQTFLYTTAQSVNYDIDGGADPTSITLSSTQIQGGGTPSAYSGRFKVETTTDNTNWTATYTSSANESSKTFSTPTNVSDTEPYCFRAVPSGVGDVVKKSAIVGGTVAWNQLNKNPNFASSSDWSNTGSATISISNNVCTVSVTAAFGGVAQISTTRMFPKGHKFLVLADVKANGSVSIQIGIGDNVNFTYVKNFTATTAYTTYTGIINQSSEISATSNKISFVRTSSGAATLNVKNFCLFDLTQMFGSTIADYIYSLETATAGAGVAYFRKLFPKSYYAYNAGQLMSVKTSGKRTSGKNIFGGEAFKNSVLTNIPTSSGSADANGNYVEWSANATTSDIVLYDKFKPNTRYTFIGKFLRSDTLVGINIGFYYTDGTYTVFYASSVTANVPFTVAVQSDSGKTIRSIASVWYSGTARMYYDDIGLFEGVLTSNDFEAYNAHTYALSDTELRGVPKLVSNKLVYDGDTYSSDGGVTRKYASVNLGSLTWQHRSEIGTGIFSTTGISNYAFKTDVNAVCAIYKYDGIVYGVDSATTNGSCYFYYTSGSSSRSFYVRNTSYSDPTAFKTAMNGVYLVYELATPTTETAQSFTALQAIDSNGTEEYVDSRDVAVPVGHNSTYISGVKAIRASLYKAGGTSTLLAQIIIPCGVDVNAGALALANDASKVSTNYITKIDESGIKVHAENNVDSNYAKIDANGMEVYKGGTSVASYGDTARIGKPTTSNEGNVYVDSDSVDIRKGATVLSTFTASGISLGKNSTDATITLASDSGSIKGHTWSNHSTNDSYNLTISNDKTITAGGYKALVLECDYPNHNDTKIRLQTGEYQNSPTDSILLTTDDESLEIRNGRITANSIQVSTYENFIQVTSLGTAGVRLGVGSDGDQHGIYTDSMERWLIAAEAEGKVFSPGIYANTTSSGSNVRVDTSGTGYLRRYTSSSRRYKEDIADLTDSELDANRLYDLRAVQFRYKEDYLDYDDQRYGKLVSGFIAEEVEEVYPIAVQYENEMAEDWEPKFLIPPMLKLIQDQKAKIDELEQRIEALERK